MRIGVVTLGLLAILSGASIAEAAELRWVGCSISKNGFMQTLAEAYERQNGTKILLEGGGATRGIRDVASGAADLGGSCRHKIMVDEERNVRLIPVGWDAIAVIVHPSNPVTSLSMEKIKAVFDGRITNWSELGGPDAEIKLVVREGRLSGVGLIVREFLYADSKHDFPASAIVEESSGPVEERVEKDPHAIAFTGIGSGRKRAVTALRIDGKAPTYNNIVNGLYQFVRPLYLVIPKSPNDEVAAFASFATSEDGQELIKQQGTVTLKDGGGLWSRYRDNRKKVRQKAKDGQS